MWGVKSASDKLKKIRKMFWSGRPDLNRGPPPEAGALPKPSSIAGVCIFKVS